MLSSNMLRFRQKRFPSRSRTAKIFCSVFAGIFLLAGFHTALAYEDCYRSCMDASGCWFSRSDENTAYCSGAQARCSTDCRHHGSRKSFGAIAYSVKDGAYGYSNGRSSRKEAEKAALKYCRKHGKKCRVEVWFYNSCGAVATDGQKVAWGQAGSVSEAGRQALQKCRRGFFKKNCEVKAAHCSR